MIPDRFSDAIPDPEDWARRDDAELGEILRALDEARKMATELSLETPHALVERLLETTLALHRQLRDHNAPQAEIQRCRQLVAQLTQRLPEPRVPIEMPPSAEEQLEQERRAAAFRTPPLFSPATTSLPSTPQPDSWWFRQLQDRQRQQHQLEARERRGGLLWFLLSVLLITSLILSVIWYSSPEPEWIRQRSAATAPTQITRSRDAEVSTIRASKTLERREPEPVGAGDGGQRSDSEECVFRQMYVLGERTFGGNPQTADMTVRVDGLTFGIKVYPSARGSTLHPQLFVQDVSVYDGDVSSPRWNLRALNALVYEKPAVSTRVARGTTYKTIVTVLPKSDWNDWHSDYGFRYEVYRSVPAARRTARK